MYVASPTGLETAIVNSTPLRFNEATGGGSLWRSLDGGKTFQNRTTPIFFGTATGGGDTDVTSEVGGTLFTADLEAFAADIQSSTDQGSTLSAPVQAGADNDREWLTPLVYKGAAKLFLTYHDLSVNYDVVMVSTDGGKSFAPAGFLGKIINPADTAATHDCANGNLISKPVTDADGGLYILLNCTAFPDNLNPTGAPLDRLYLAVSRDGGATFKTTLVNDVSNGGTKSGAYGKVFNQLGIDAGGNLYVAASGALTGDQVAVHTYLIRSFDNGKTWKDPINLNTAAPNHAQVFPAIAVGQAGQVAVGYYGTTICQTITPACKPNDYRGDGNIFQFYITQSLNALDSAPTFITTQVTTTSPHQNGICTDGIFCGVPILSAGGNRNLADFESMTVDPSGHIELVIPADPDNVKPDDFKPTVNWFFKQTSGPLMVPGATNGNGTGNQTYVASSTRPAPPLNAPGPPRNDQQGAVIPVPNTGAVGDEGAALGLLAAGGAALAGAVAVLGRRREPSTTGSETR